MAAKVPCQAQPTPLSAPLQSAPVAQLDRAPDYESGGQRFESFRVRQQGPLPRQRRRALLVLPRKIRTRSESEAATPPETTSEHGQRGNPFGCAFAFALKRRAQRVRAAWLPRISSGGRLALRCLRHRCSAHRVRWPQSSTASSSACMSSSDRPKWCPASWITTWRTSSARPTPVSRISASSGWRNRLITGGMRS